MDYLATSGTPEMFDLARKDYFDKLQKYHDANPQNSKSIQQFTHTENQRAEQLALFNNPGSGNDSNGDNATVHPGLATPGSKSAGI